MDIYRRERPVPDSVGVPWFSQLFEACLLRARARVSTETGNFQKPADPSPCPSAGIAHVQREKSKRKKEKTK